MHQRQRVQDRSTVTRIVSGTLAAVTLAVTLTVAHGWSPICVLLTPDDPLWYVFTCWWDPPPPPPPNM
jgi:hypothetical protein